MKQPRSSTSRNPSSKEGGSRSHREASRWLGPVATSLVGGHLRSRARWYQQGFASLNQNLGEYLAEESRTLVGQREAEARFSELDQIKLDLERLEARFERLSRSLDPSDNA